MLPCSLGSAIKKHEAAGTAGIHRWSLMLPSSVSSARVISGCFEWCWILSSAGRSSQLEFSLRWKYVSLGKRFFVSLQRNFAGWKLVLGGFLKLFLRFSLRFL